MKKRKIIIIFGVIIVGIAGFMIFQTTRPLKVETVVVNKEPYKEYHFEEGLVLALDYVNIYSPITGRVLSISAEEGDTVKLGDSIFAVDDKDLNYNLDRLLSQRQSIVGLLKSESFVINQGDLEIQNEIIAIKERTVEATKDDFENSGLLYEEGALSLEAYDQSRDLYNNAVNQLNVERLKLAEMKKPSQYDIGIKEHYNKQIEMIDIEINRLKGKIEKAKVKAPRDGIISTHSFKVGDIVVEDQLLFSIINSNETEIEANVISKYAKNIKPGDKVEVEIDNEFGSQAYLGSVEFRSNYAKEIVSPLGLVEKKVKVSIKPDNKANLIIGEKVDVKFITYENESTLVISKDYIFPWEDGDGIWVIENGLTKVYKISKSFETASKILMESSVDTLEIIIPPYPEKIEENMKVDK